MNLLHRATPLTKDLQPKKRYRWWHAAAVGLAANAVSTAPFGYNGDEAFYNDLKKPPGSPPDWAFAPVWAFNNAITLWSNLRVANLPEGTPGRRAALCLEGASWGLFASFTTLYFGLRSPVLGAANTVAGLAATAASVAITARLDHKAAWALSPRLAWLGLATYVSICVALRNRDAFIGWDPDARGVGEKPFSGDPPAEQHIEPEAVQG